MILQHRKRYLNITTSLNLAVVFLCTTHASSHARTESTVSYTKKDSAKPTDISSVLIETRKIRKIYLEEISDVERHQPEWDSTPLKELLRKTVKHLETTQEPDYWDYQQMLVLSCQTPLLEVRLVKSANAMFHALDQWCRERNSLWVRSGGESSVMLPYLSKNNQRLKARFEKIESTQKVPQIRDMQRVFSECSQLLNLGDTQAADLKAWKVLKLAEASRNYELTADVLEWYISFLRMMNHRPNREIYQVRNAYVSREHQCVRFDNEFEKALESTQDTISLDVTYRLRNLHTEIIKERRSGEKNLLKAKYAKFIEGANSSGDQTGSVQYHALYAYHAYLQTDRTVKNYDELRAELFNLWTIEELRKQPIQMKLNMKRGGDWEKLESVFQKLEEQRIFVCRSMKLCRMWGEPSADLILRKEQELKPSIGMVYYDHESPYNGSDLYLECRGPSELKLCSGCKTVHHTECDRQTVLDRLVKALQEAGFEPKVLKSQSNYIRITGDWSPVEKVLAPAEVRTNNISK